MSNGIWMMRESVEKAVKNPKKGNWCKKAILCTISLAIPYVSQLFVLIFVQCQSISIAMTRTRS